MQGHCPNFVEYKGGCVTCMLQLFYFSLTNATKDALIGP